jgi:hypothetical protein
MTPKKDEAAMVIVDSGPAFAMSIFKFCANSVGNQFLTPQPGRLGTAK